MSDGYMSRQRERQDIVLAFDVLTHELSCQSRCNMDLNEFTEPK